MPPRRAGTQPLHPIYQHQPLRRDDERAVLDEGPRVTQVRDVLAGGALSGVAAPSDGVGSRGVETERMPLEGFAQVATDRIVRDGRGCDRRVAVDLRLLEEGEHVSRHDGLSLGDPYLAHDAGALGGDGARLHGYDGSL